MLSIISATFTKKCIYFDFKLGAIIAL